MAWYTSSGSITMGGLRQRGTCSVCLLTPGFVHQAPPRGSIPAIRPIRASDRTARFQPTTSGRRPLHRAMDPRASRIWPCTRSTDFAHTVVGAAVVGGHSPRRVDRRQRSPRRGAGGERPTRGAGPSFVKRFTSTSYRPGPRGPVATDRPGIPRSAAVDPNPEGARLSGAPLNPGDPADPDETPDRMTPNS